MNLIEMKLITQRNYAVGRLNRAGLTSALLIALVIVLSGCEKAPQQITEEPAGPWPKIDWRSVGETQLELAKARQINNRIAKNIILFVGDGMSVTTVTAARILEGQLRGQAGEENLLSFEKFPYTSMSKTYSVDRQVADSAATATAMLTGIKTKSGFISVSEEANKGDCATDAQMPPTLLELAELAGLSTGVVTTAAITHATPATAYAHGSSRGWQSDGRVPAAAKAAGCTDFASQLVNMGLSGMVKSNGLEVALGGGRANFMPNTLADPVHAEMMGRRLDGVELDKKWLERFDKSAYVWNLEQFDQVDAAETDHLLGLFDYDHMAFSFEREAQSQPSLPALTEKAIDILAKNPNGFFLLVEAGRIDHGHHGGNAYRALTDTVELSDAVAMALSKTSAEDTLILVTADHSHALTMAGYAGRGEPILGLGGLDKNGKAYTTLGYANGPGAVEGSRPEVTRLEAMQTDYRQQALVERKSETHGGDDVIIYGHGVKSHLLGGVVEQNFIFYLLEDAAQLISKAQHQDATRQVQTGENILGR